ncbi:hypothetical protein MAMC_01093 [Methylacidimicrobium cyclopophantes]|uniref:phosphoglycolate phosphatase n=1 Tax=Methylacidimicrobium cyclopophantes TaxID=1041766 RepID=A0A5E6MF39_9BACT|nr:HAD family hydrolase [Methylacidimicrobium cyclopophantes]VVM06443.1 hypothetical protein MAMC_01093 [Methylacidimicrobium cyclopophantes]
MTPLRIILWDIDGTLLHSGGAGERAIVLATQALYGEEIPLQELDYRGRTDSLIVRQIFSRLNIPWSEENVTRYKECYLRHLAEEISRSSGATYRGVEPLLSTIQRMPDWCQGLLTGNFEGGAKIKLEHFGLGHFFSFGTFGDQSDCRNELARSALQLVRKRWGEALSPRQLFLIGDTPHDILCAKAIGAYSVAVATGGYSLSELAAFRPTMLLPDLEQFEPVLALVKGRW